MGSTPKVPVRAGGNVEFVVDLSVQQLLHNVLERNDAWMT
jgi:hypothetical protein